MTQLELVEHDLTPCGNGLPIQRTVVAVSSSYSALCEYSVEKYNTEIGHENVNELDKYYTIHDSNIAIIPSKI